MGRFSKRLGRAMRHGEKGFTLIELLIVVAILGILAAVIIPNIAGFIRTGKLSAANTELENVKTASLAYYADNNGTYPASSANLVPSYLAGTATGSYDFDTTYGWVVSGVGWTDLTWAAGTPGLTGSHGKWTK